MAVAKDHPGVEELAAFTLGTLDDETDASIGAHVASCTSCQERAAHAPDDTFVELLRSVHTRPGLGADTVAELAAQVQTPPPLAADPAALLALAVAAPVQAESDRGEVPDAMPAELACHERYRVVRLLGAGGMGAVYEAEHRVMQRPVALKVINRAFTARPAVVERFRREVRAAARLSHPNIVTTFDAEDAGSTLFLVMEYVEGINLARVVKEHGPLPVAEACAYVRQAALGLQHAHERGMVHRDVKPENLVRCGDGTVKVLDFGLAALTTERGGDGLTEANAIMGTPDYMAPEQAENAHRADIRADVYSLGCTLYHLLTGRVPYPEATALRRILAHKEQPIPSLRKARPDAPPELAAVLARLLAKKPGERYQTPGEVATALEPFTRPDTIRPSRKPRGFLVAAAALVLLVASALAAWSGYLIWHPATYRVQTDSGEITLQTDDPDVEVVMKRGGQLVRIIDPKSKQTWELDTTTYQIGTADEPDGLKIELPRKEPFVLKRGNTGILRVTRAPKIAVNPNEPKERPLTAPKTLEVVRRFSWPNRSGATSFSADGKLCVGFARNDFRIWEVESGNVVRDFTNLPQLVTVRFMPGGKQLISSHTDGTFRQWELANGKEIGQLQGPVGWNLLGGISPDGSRFCFWNDQAGIFIYDWEKRKELLHVRGLEKSALLASHGLSPDGKLLATADFSKAEGETVVRLFNAKTGELVRSISSRLWPDNLSWGEDSHCVYVNGGDAGRHLIVCWNAETGEQIFKANLEPDLGSSYGRYFSHDGRYFGMQYPDKELLHLYDTRSGQLVGTAHGPVASFSLSFSPNNREMASGSQGEVILYRLPTAPVPKDKP
jgi:serine/threonine protein kinase